MAKVLIGCEESQAVCIEFRKLGIDAYSCDLKECSGGHPEWHLKMDVFKAINRGLLKLENNDEVFIDKWDMLIAFPDCTYITVSANTWYRDQPKRKSGVLVGEERESARNNALQFVCDLLNCGIPRISIENPVGVIGTRIFKHIDGQYKVFPTSTIGGLEPSQIIQPFYFGDNAKKTTCLWLINLPLLVHVDKDNLFEQATHVDAGEFWEFKSKKGIDKKFSKWYVDALNLNPKDRATARSKTFPGIAKAMAEQWGKII